MKLTESQLRQIIREELLSERRSNADHYHSSHGLIVKAKKTLKQLRFELSEAGSELPQPERRGDPTDKAQKALWKLADQCDTMKETLEDLQDDVHDLQSSAKD